MNKRARIIISNHLRSLADQVLHVDARHLDGVLHALELGVVAMRENLGVEARRKLERETKQ